MSASGLHMGDLHMRDPSSEEEALEYLEYEYDEDGAAGGGGAGGVSALRASLTPSPDRDPGSDRAP